jgi:hypothetical protein
VCSQKLLMRSMLPHSYPTDLGDGRVRHFAIARDRQFQEPR